VSIKRPDGLQIDDINLQGINIVNVYVSNKCSLILTLLQIAVVRA